ncbi:MAG TPA: hypothetical protein ENK84_13455 [Desulfobulbus sp.]|nr:hypothetical protein [Desulfobulbus sp.]
MQTETEQVLDLKLDPAAAVRLDISAIMNEHKLVHLHPHWFVDEEERRGDMLFVQLRDYETDREFSLGLRLHVFPEQEEKGQHNIMQIQLVDYGATELLFFTDQDKTRVRVRYSSQQEKKDAEQEVLLWIRAIQEYLRLYTTTTPHTFFFRILMNKMMLQMNPSQRNICIMITKITIIELLVILILVVGYVYFS